MKGGSEFSSSQSPPAVIISLSGRGGDGTGRAKGTTETGTAIRRMERWSPPLGRRGPRKVGDDCAGLDESSSAADVNSALTGVVDAGKELASAASGSRRRQKGAELKFRTSRTKLKGAPSSDSLQAGSQQVEAAASSVADEANPSPTTLAATAVPHKIVAAGPGPRCGLPSGRTADRSRDSLHPVASTARLLAAPSGGEAARARSTRRSVLPYASDSVLELGELDRKPGGARRLTCRPGGSCVSTICVDGAGLAVYDHPPPFRPGRGGLDLLLERQNGAGHEVPTSRRR